MREVSADELEKILKNNLDFVLELGILQEPKLCVKPVYKFIKAYIGDENIPEFALIYCEADDPEEIYISANPQKSRESFYYDCRGCSPLRPACPANKTQIKLLNENDKNLCGEYYFNTVFDNFIIRKIYRDCGIIGAFDENNNFIGYLAYYEIAENIRDVSYIYINENYRGKNYGKDLLNFFVNKNIDENKISYYSYADGEISENLVKSCGLLSCAKRKEPGGK